MLSAGTDGPDPRHARLWKLMATLLLQGGAVCVALCPCQMTAAPPEATGAVPVETARSTDYEESLVRSFVASAAAAEERAAQIRVAVFDIGRNSRAVTDYLPKIMASEPACRAELVSPAEVRNAALDGFDVVIFPGGSGKKQGAALDEEGRRAVREFVRTGGGYVGICAGAFLTTTTHDVYLAVVNAKTDVKRGAATVEVETTESGSRTFTSFPRSFEVRFAGGPIFSPAARDDLSDYITLGRYRTEFSATESQQATMVGTPAIIAARYGEGRVIAFSFHPEVREDTGSLVKRAVLSTAAPEAPWLVGRTVPRWADVAPRRTLQVEHDADKADEENGAALARAIQGLQPGDMLRIGPGRYSIARKFAIDLQGTADAPIWIVAADADRLPVVTRPDARQNVVNVGERSRTEYVCFRHLELTGGSTLIRFYDCHDLWLDQCHLHHAGHEGITTNTRDTSRLFITRNHFHDFTDPSATGEAMYLGANHGKVVMSYSVIAENHVHHCGGTQGDGIELKQGSHHNWICGNHVHDTNYPCILAYGSGGKGLNVIERNVCYRSNDNVLQVQGDAIVRNNLLMAAEGSGFASTDHQGKTTRLTFVHNTILSRRRGANLSSWNGRAGMVFANNVVCTDRGDALRFAGGADGVTVSGNVLLGRVSGVAEGFVVGNGQSDFVDVSWDGNRRDARLAEDCPFIGQADSRYAAQLDITGNKRGSRPTAGAYDAP